MILAIQTPSHSTDLWLLPDHPTPRDPTTHHPAAATDSDPIAHVQWESGRELSSHLHTHILDLLAAHQASLTDLTGIIIFSGPGSFTSLRIGHTVANALADSLGIPVTSASGDDWVGESLAKLTSADIGSPVLPFYGSEANITKPKS